VTAVRELSDPEVWQAASVRASRRAETLDPQGSIDRFVAAVEQTLTGRTS
jgi:hypothetical protein